MASIFLIGNSGILRHWIEIERAGHKVKSVIIAKSRVIPSELNRLMNYALSSRASICIGNKIDFDHIASANDSDILVSAGWPYVIHHTILSRYQFALNIHPSLLPDYKGHLALWKMILNKEKKTGVTVHLMIQTVDSGPIVVQEEWDIHPYDTNLSLLKKFKERSVRAIIKAIENILKPDFQPSEQNLDRNFCQSLCSDDHFKLSLEASLEENITKIRASLPPKFPAHVIVKGKRLNLAVWPDDMDPLDLCYMFGNCQEECKLKGK